MASMMEWPGGGRPRSPAYFMLLASHQSEASITCSHVCVSVCVCMYSKPQPSLSLRSTGTTKGGAAVEGSLPFVVPRDVGYPEPLFLTSKGSFFPYPPPPPDTPPACMASASSSPSSS